MVGWNGREGNRVLAAQSFGEDTWSQGSRACWMEKGARGLGCFEVGQLTEEFSNPPLLGSDC